MQSIDQVSQGAGFDIRRVLQGALGVNMTVNNSKKENNRSLKQRSYSKED